MNTQTNLVSENTNEAARAAMQSGTGGSPVSPTLAQTLKADESERVLECGTSVPLVPARFATGVVGASPLGSAKTSVSRPEARGNSEGEGDTPAFSPSLSDVHGTKVPAESGTKVPHSKGLRAGESGGAGASRGDTGEPPVPLSQPLTAAAAARVARMRRGAWMGRAALFAAAAGVAVGAELWNSSEEWTGVNSGTGGSPVFRAADFVLTRGGIEGRDVGRVVRAGDDVRGVSGGRFRTGEPPVPLSQPLSQPLQQGAKVRKAKWWEGARAEAALKDDWAAGYTGTVNVWDASTTTGGIWGGNYWHAEGSATLTAWVGGTSAIAVFDPGNGTTSTTTHSVSREGLGALTLDGIWVRTGELDFSMTGGDLLTLNTGGKLRIDEGATLKIDSTVGFSAQATVENSGTFSVTRAAFTSALELASITGGTLDTGANTLVKLNALGGELIKTGAGSALIAGSISAEKIKINEGTLVLGNVNGADKGTFIAAGAKLDLIGKSVVLTGNILGNGSIVNTKNTTAAYGGANSNSTIRVDSEDCIIEADIGKDIFLHVGGGVVYSGAQRVTLSGKNDFSTIMGTEQGENFMMRIGAGGYLYGGGWQDGLLPVPTVEFTNKQSLGDNAAGGSPLIIFLFPGAAIYSGDEDAQIAGMYTQYDHAGSLAAAKKMNNLHVTNPDVTLSIGRFVNYSNDNRNNARLGINGPGTVRINPTTTLNRNAMVTVWSGTLELDAALKTDGTIHALSSRNSEDALIVTGGKVRLLGNNRDVHDYGNQFFNTSRIALIGGTFDMNGQNERIAILASTSVNTYYVNETPAPPLLTNSDAEHLSTLKIGYANNSSSSFSGAVSGRLSIYKEGTGSLTLGGAVTLAGEGAGITLAAGSVTLSGAVDLSGAGGGITITAGSFTVNTPAATNEQNNLGKVTLNANTLAVSGGAGAKIIGFGSATAASKIDLTNTAAKVALEIETAGDVTFAGSLTGGALAGSATMDAALKKSGAGKLTLTGASNNLSGPISIAEGVLQIGDASTASSFAGTGAVTLGGEGTSLILAKTSALLVTRDILGEGEFIPQVSLLEFTGSTASGVTFNISNTVEATGGPLAGPVVMTAGSLSSAPSATLGSGITISGAGRAEVGGSITGAVLLSGTARLSAFAGISGEVTLAGGSQLESSAGISGGAVTVADTATLTARTIATGGANGVAVSGSGSVTVENTLNAGAVTLGDSSRLNVGGKLTAGGLVTVSGTSVLRAGSISAAGGVDVQNTATLALPDAGASVNKLALHAGTTLDLGNSAVSFGDLTLWDTSTIILPVADLAGNVVVTANSLAFREENDELATIILDVMNIAGNISPLEALTVFRVSDPAAITGDGAFTLRGIDGLRATDVHVVYDSGLGTVNIEAADGDSAHELHWAGTVQGGAEDLPFTWAAGTNSGYSNWYDRTTGTASEKFFQYDHVIFNDEPTEAGVKSLTVKIADKVRPSSVLVAGDSDYLFEGVPDKGIQGSGKLTKIGTGTLTINATGNTFTGGTVLDGGNIIAKTATALGTGSVTMSAGTGLSVASGFANNVHVDAEGGEVRLEVAVGMLGTETSSFAGTLSGAGTVKLHSWVTGLETSLTANSTRVFAKSAPAFTGALEIGNGITEFAADNADWGGTDFYMLGDSSGSQMKISGNGTVRFASITNKAGSIYLSLKGRTTVLDVPALTRHADGLQLTAIGVSRVMSELTGKGELTSSTGTLTIDTSTVNAGFYTTKDMVIIDYTEGGVGGSAKPVTVVKEGPGMLSFDEMNSYSGGLIINGGTVRVGKPLGGYVQTAIPAPANGETAQAGRAEVENRANLAVTINSGGTYLIDGCLLAPGTATAPLTSFLINAGGTLTTNAVNRIANLTLAGGTLANSGSGGTLASTSFGAWQILGTVKVVGDGVSTISGNNPNRLGVGTNQTITFNVGKDATLVVDAVLANAAAASMSYVAVAAGTGSSVVLDGGVLEGSGRLIFTKDSTYTGSTGGAGTGTRVVNNGTLQIGGSVGSDAGTEAGLPGASGVLDIQDTSTLDIRRTNDATFGGSLKLAPSATLIKQGGGSGKMTIASASVVRGTMKLDSGSLEFTAVASEGLQPASLQIGSSSFIRATGGKLELKSAGVSWAGREVPQASTFDIDLGTAGTLTVSNGHTLRVGSPAAAIEHETLKVQGAVTLDNAVLGFDIGAAGADLLDVAGSVSVSAPGTIVLYGDINTWGSLSYDLIKATVASPALLAEKFTLDDTNLVNSEKILARLDKTGNTLRLTLKMTEGSLFWNDIGNSGAEAGVWKVDATGLVNNWRDESGTPTYYWEDYANPDAPIAYTVVFNTAYSSTKNISIPERVRPFSILVDSALDYTFTNVGTGYIDGETTLVKSGTGKLTLTGDMPNDFKRTVFLRGGSIELTGGARLLGNVGEASLLGAGYADTGAEGIVLSSGTLRFKGSAGNATTTNRSFTVGAATIEAAATAAGTLVWFNGTDEIRVTAAAQGGASVLTLSGAGGAEALSAPGVSQPVTAGGALGLPIGGGSALSVVKTGAGAWHLSNTTNTFSGGLTVRDGALSFTNGAALGNGEIRMEGGALALAKFDDTGAGVLFAENGGDDPLAVTLTGKNITFAGGALGVIYDYNVLTLAGNTLAGATQPLVKVGTGKLIVGGNATADWHTGARVLAGTIETLQQDVLGYAGSTTDKTGLLELAPGATAVIGNGDGSPTNPGSLRLSGLAGEGGTVTNGRPDAVSADLTLNTSTTYEHVFKGGFSENGTDGVLNITKAGLGTQVFAGNGSTLTANSTVQVQGGTLRLAAAQAVGSASIRLNNSGTTLDVTAVNFAAGGLVPKVTVNDSGADITNSTGGATLPEIVLATDGTVKTGGATTLGKVSGTHTLSLKVHTTKIADVDIPTTSTPLFIAGAVTETTVGVIDVADAVTLRLDASERLHDSISPDVGATLALGATATLALPARATKQTFKQVSGTGDITGSGTIILQGVATQAAWESNLPQSQFGARLTGAVSLELPNGRWLELKNPDTDTDGDLDATFRILTGATLISRLATDAFGTATISIEDGTLRLQNTAYDVVLGEHNFHFTGTGATIASTGAGVTVNGTTTYGTEVGDIFALRLGGTPVVETPHDSTFNVRVADPDWVLGAKTMLVKLDGGTWVLASTGNTYTGGTFVNEGTLKLGASNAIPAATELTLGSAGKTGTLDLNGFNLDVSNISRAQSANTNSTVINTRVLGDTLPALTWTVAAGATQGYKASLGDSANPDNNRYSFVKRGAGTLTLGESGLGGVYFTGSTTVAEGTLKIGGAASFPASEVFKVSPGATFDVSPLGAPGATLGAGVTLTAGSARDAATSDLLGTFVLDGGRLAVGERTALDATSTLRLGGTLSLGAPESEILFNLARHPGDTSSLLRVSTLSLAAPGAPLGAGGDGNIRFAFARGYATPGDYTLVEYGALASAGDPLESLAAAMADFGDERYTISLENVPGAGGAGRIVLHLVIPGNETAVEWIGGPTAPESLWSDTDANFTSGFVNVVAAPAAKLLFSDAKAASYDVWLPRDVVIGDAVFDNSAQPFTISGAPGAAISGEGRITKYGTSDLVLLTENTYRGQVGADGKRLPATYLYEGRILLGTDTALGPDAVRVFGGALGKVGAADRHIANAFEIRDNADFTIEAGADGLFELSGAITGGAGATIAKTGAATLLLSGDTSKFTGTLHAGAGALALKNDTDLSAATVSLAGAAVLSLVGTPGSFTYHIGALEGGAGTFIRATTAGTKTLEVGALGADTTFSGKFDNGVDSIALDKVGSGTLTLTGANNGLEGRVNILAGALRVGDGASGARIPGLISIEPGASLILELPDSLNLTEDGATLIAKPGSTIEKRGANTLSLHRAYDNLEGTLKVTAGTLALTSGGTFGTATIINNALVALDREDDYTFANAISGTGIIHKNGAGAATYLGAHTGTGTTFLDEGTLQFGDPAMPAAALTDTLKDQKHLAAIVTQRGTLLRLAPAEGIKLVPGKITVQDVTGTGRIEKTGGGLAILNGEISVHEPSNGNADIRVFEGELRIGDRDPRNTFTTLNVGSSIRVDAGATLSVGRAGATMLNQPVTSEGSIVILGDLAGDGVTVLASPANAISGKIAVQRAGVLQVGDTVSTSRIGDGVSLAEITLDPHGTLRFTRNATPSSGASLTVLSLQPGAGIIEYDGGERFHFDSATASGVNDSFTGTFLASAGVFSVNAASIPAGATLDAKGAGTLLVLAEPHATHGVTQLDTALGGGGGNLALGSRTGAAAFYEMPSGAAFAGSLSVTAATTLRLTQPAISPASEGEPLAPPVPGVFAVKALRVENGARLEGVGTVGAAGSVTATGDLINLVGGTLAPGSNGAGAITATGGFENFGTLEIQAGASLSTGQIRYAGQATLHASGTLIFRIPKTIYDHLYAGAEFKILDDTNTTDTHGTEGSVHGNFSPGNIYLQLLDDEGNAVGGALGRELLTYNKGNGGLTLLVGGDTDAINGFRLSPALNGWKHYINDSILRGTDSTLKAVVGQMLGAPGLEGIRKAYTAASPLGLASMTAMPIGIARDASEILHGHLESRRFNRPLTTSTNSTFQPYILGTGIFENNASKDTAPAFNYRTYGAQAGADINLGDRFLLGASAGYAHGNATMADSAGTVRDDNVRGTLYGSAILDRQGRWYADASAFAGYSDYSVRHHTVSGAAKAAPEGYDYGATFSVGGVASVPRVPVHITPYAAIEYTRASVSGFTEHGSDAALRLNRFEQDSLRAKFGAGLSWIVPTYADFNLRLGLNATYYRELLDTTAALRGSFALDHSGAEFRVNAPGIFQDFVQLGPVVDIDFTDRISFRAAYNYGTDLHSGESHQINATFRIRF